ncbi:MAG: hypothetical protein K8R54_19295 [Bacteroidales bacterium]|nr:hypothetical protein [Bacteroidales bacterium]
MSDKLDFAFSNYKVISSFTKKAKALTLKDKKYVSEFNLPIFGKKFKNYNKDIDEYFDSINDTILEYAYLELFANFEAIVIEKIKLASGGMIKAIKENYDSSLPFVSYEKRFVKSINDLGGLNKILDLLRNKISSELFSELETIVKYRNRLAHGKRFNENIVLNSIEDSYKTMRKILKEL